jgi:hypothetical protein
MAYGPDAVAELVERSGWSYPVTVRRLEREHALANVQVDERGNTAMLGEVLARSEASRFENPEDLRKKLEPAFEAESASRRRGLVGYVKSLLGR